MPDDDRLLAALEAAVSADPTSVPLRLHLAELLCEAGRATDALDHAAAALEQVPDDVRALEVAARSAELAGDAARAAGYRRLLASLGGEEPAAPIPATAGLDPVPPADPGDSALRDELDQFLAEVLGGGAVDLEQPKVTLADVGGLEEVKRRLNTSFLGPMANPELRRMYGTSLRGGLLLYGPPGCGKTFLARAVAGELGARFFAIGLHEVLDMWLGASERNLHAVFETARRHAPSVLFLDEVDALGQKRSHLSHSAGRNVVVQLLSEMDSIGSSNEGVFVLGATNQPWDVDPALRRPGRFDRTVLVLPPDKAARVAILAYHLRERPVGDVNLTTIAEVTDGYSGADLRLLCEAAAQLALESSIATGEPRPISDTDFVAARRDVRPTTGPWFEAARNYALFANDSGEYDDLLAYIRAHRLG